MKCDRCNRPMDEPAVTIRKRKGFLNYGPKCARLMGIATGRARARATKNSPAPVDPAQMELELTQ